MKMKRSCVILLLAALCLGVSAKPKQKTPTVRLETTAGTIRLKLYDDTPKHRDNFLRIVRDGVLDSVVFHRVIRDFMIQAGDPTARVHAASDGSLLYPPRDKALGEGDLGYTLPPEFCLPWYYHERGALAAAREGDDVNPQKRSSASQFYIVYGRTFTSTTLGRERAALQEQGIEMTSDMFQTYLTKGGTPHLDGNYTVFGQVIDGMKVVKAIQSTPTDSLDRPLTDVVILRAVVEGDTEK